jgi:hypothetical protein
MVDIESIVTTSVTSFVETRFKGSSEHYGGSLIDRIPMVTGCVREFLSHVPDLEFCDMSMIFIGDGEYGMCGDYDGDDFAFYVTVEFVFTLMTGKSFSVRAHFDDFVTQRYESDFDFVDDKDQFVLSWFSVFSSDFTKSKLDHQSWMEFMQTM